MLTLHHNIPKMKRTLALIIVLLLAGRLFAYDIINPVGGRAAAMGRSSVASQGLWSILNNPAGLAGLDKMELGIYYENYWMLDATAYKSAAFAIPLNYGTIGLSFNQFGYSKFSENKFGLAYARDFGRYLQIGLQLDYYLLNAGENYGKKSAITFELGIQSKITDKLTLGTYIFNPASLTLRQTINNEPLPIVFRFGASYRFTKEFLGQLEVEKNTELSGCSFRGGVEYEAFKDFFIRAGAQIGTNPQNQQGILTFGLGYKIRFAEINIAGQMHQALGNAVQIGMIFSFGK